MQTIPAEQPQAFLGESKATGVYEMYYIELVAGLRRGELPGLKWTDIDWKNGIINVRRSIARVDGGERRIAAKNKELLPCGQHFTPSDRSSETAEGENQCPVCVPLPQWWSHLAG